MRAQNEGIITGDSKRSMGIWRKVEGRGHETEEKDKKRKKRCPAAKRVERSGIVNGRDAKETHAEKEQSPNVPAFPEAEQSEREESHGKKQRHVMMKASIEGTQNVAAVQLGDRQEVERSSEEPNPGGAANGMQQEHAGANPWMKDGSEESQQEWGSED